MSLSNILVPNNYEFFAGMNINTGATGARGASYTGITGLPSATGDTGASATGPDGPQGRNLNATLTGPTGSDGLPGGLTGMTGSVGTGPSTPAPSNALLGTFSGAFGWTALHSGFTGNGVSTAIDLPLNGMSATGYYGAKLAFDSKGRLTTPVVEFSSIAYALWAQNQNVSSGPTTNVLANSLVAGRPFKNVGSNLATATGIFTCPVSGYYAANCCSTWTTNGGGTARRLWIMRVVASPPSSTVLSGEDASVLSSVNVSNSACVVYKFDAGDTIRFYVQQDSGSTLNSTHLCCIYYLGN